MHSHLDSVAERALVVPTPTRGRDLLEVLAPYTDEVADSKTLASDAEPPRPERIR